MAGVLAGFFGNVETTAQKMGGSLDAMLLKAGAGTAKGLGYSLIKNNLYNGAQADATAAALLPKLTIGERLKAMNVASSTDSAFAGSKLQKDLALDPATAAKAQTAQSLLSSRMYQFAPTLASEKAGAKASAFLNSILPVPASPSAAVKQAQGIARASNKPTSAGSAGGTLHATMATAPAGPTGPSYLPDGAQIIIQRPTGIMAQLSAWLAKVGL